MSESDFYTNLRPLIEEMIDVQSKHTKITQEFDSVREQYIICNDQLRAVNMDMDHLKKVLDYCCEHQVDPSYARLMLSNQKSDSTSGIVTSPRVMPKLMMGAGAAPAESQGAKSPTWVQRWARRMLQKIS